MVKFIYHRLYKFTLGATKMNIIEKADLFAERKHKNQKRLNGEPYITHPRRVADIVKRYKRSHKIEELIAAALLHDTLEDTSTSVNELRDNFGDLITQLVMELTTDEKKKKILGKTRYLSEKLSQNDKVSNWTLVIKLADRLDNISDLEFADISFKNKYIRETKDILDYIDSKRELTGTHKKLISAIRDKIKELT